MAQQELNLRWLWQMAWRDSRKNRGRLILFLSAIVLGIAALVAINSFGDNLDTEIQKQARELLGADLTLEARSDTAHILLDLPVVDSAQEIIFASMVSFPGTEGARLIQVRVLEGAYPFYGQLATEPVPAANTFQNGQNALVDRTLKLQFGARIGSKVKIGALEFNISGNLAQLPGPRQRGGRPS